MWSVGYCNTETNLFYQLYLLTNRAGPLDLALEHHQQNVGENFARSILSCGRGAGVSPYNAVTTPEYRIQGTTAEPLFDCLWNIYIPWIISNVLLLRLALSEYIPLIENLLSFVWLYHLPVSPAARRNITRIPGPGLGLSGQPAASHRLTTTTRQFLETNSNHICTSNISNNHNVL